MKIRIDGLDCPNCAKTLEKHINNLESVKRASINFLKATIEFESDIPEQAIQDIIALAAKIEPSATIIYQKNNGKNHKRFLIDSVTLIFGTALALFTLLFKALPTWAYWILFVISALVIGYKTYYKAIRLLLKGTINENLLITLSVIGATAVGEHFDGLMVVTLYSIGKILEGLAVAKSKKSIEELTNFKPDYAILLTPDGEKKVTPDTLEINDIIVVRPGEKVAVDGIIIEGKSTLDMQSLTGESLPIEKNVHDEILSGSIILDGVIQVKVTKKYKESTVNKIINLIENATEKKSKAETIISKITKWYTLGVMACSIIVWGIVWIITKQFSTALYRGLIFLVVSCPCAFAISVPLAYFSGLGNASKHGILIKGSNYLDQCAKLNVLAFDKTGTLTSGVFEVEQIETLDNNLSQEDILYLASLGEQYSLHPLAKSIVSSNTKPLKQVFNVKEEAGVGVYYTYEKNKYFVGRKTKEISGTIVELFRNDKKIGQIILADQMKPESYETLTHLKELHVTTAMLTGDHNSVATKVANQLGIDEVHSGLLPQEKYAWIEQSKTHPHTCIGYVGDGLNDAPSLTLADVGFCMGMKGNSASIETSDVIIATDNLKKIPETIKISKYTRKIVWQNIILSALIKLVFLSLGAIGITGMLEAVIADVGVTLLAIFNALRALKYNPAKKKCSNNACTIKNNNNNL